jgi:threonine dehydrogenase-like Zn-dependent dehydrogenase
VTRTTRAVVQTAARTLEMRELPLPEIRLDEGLLRVETCGICGSDYEQYAGALPVRYPAIPGHEPVGRIAEIGETAARRWGVTVGYRVCVEALVPCGNCRECLAGTPRLCTGRPGVASYGFLGLDLLPGLWGG